MSDTQNFLRRKWARKSKNLAAQLRKFRDRRPCIVPKLPAKRQSVVRLLADGEPGGLTPELADFYAAIIEVTPFCWFPRMPHEPHNPDELAIMFSTRLADHLDLAELVGRGVREKQVEFERNLAAERLLDPADGPGADTSRAVPVANSADSSGPAVGSERSLIAGVYGDAREILTLPSARPTRVVVFRYQNIAASELTTRRYATPLSIIR